MDGGGHPPVAINQLGGTRRTPQIIDGGREAPDPHAQLLLLLIVKPSLP